jgi:hypothetical protein
MPGPTYAVNHGRAAGTLSKRQFANVTKRWPLGGANEGNATLDVTDWTAGSFDAGMVGTIASGAEKGELVPCASLLDNVVFILDDSDSYDVVESGMVPYLQRPNYTAETSALYDPDNEAYAAGDVLYPDLAHQGLLYRPDSPLTVGTQSWQVTAVRNEVLSDGTTVVVATIVPIV